jgi:hypothetical protein
VLSDRLPSLVSFSRLDAPFRRRPCRSPDTEPYPEAKQRSLG